MTAIIPVYPEMVTQPYQFVDRFTVPTRSFIDLNQPGTLSPPFSGMANIARAISDGTSVCRFFLDEKS